MGQLNITEGWVNKTKNPNLTPPNKATTSNQTQSASIEDCLNKKGTTGIIGTQSFDLREGKFDMFLANISANETSINILNIDNGSNISSFKYDVNKGFEFDKLTLNTLISNEITEGGKKLEDKYIQKTVDQLVSANTTWESGKQISAHKAVLGGLVHENNMLAYGVDKIGYSTVKNAFVVNDKKIAGIEDSSILNGAVRWDGSKLVTIADTVAYKDKSNIFTQVNTFTNLVNINTATGNLQIGSTNSGWVHFLSNNNLYSDKAWHAKNGFTVYNTNNKLIDTGLHSNYANITTYLTAADATVTNTLTGNIINATTYSATDKVKSNVLNPYTGNLININSSLKVFDNSIGVANSIGTEDYISGLTGRGWRVDNSGYLGVGDIYARGSLTVSTFINQKIAISNGDLIVSDSKKIKLYTSQYADNIYFKKGENPFKVGNVLRCKTQSKDYKITVIQVTDSTAYPEYEYCKFNNKTGTGNIETDDFLVRWSGGLLFLSSSSPDSPYYDVVYNGITQARFGNTAGINSPEWGQLSGYSIWADGAYFDNVHVSGIIKVKAGSNVYDKTTVDSNISTAKSAAISTANGYTDTLKNDLGALAYKTTLNDTDTTFIVGGKLTNSFIDTNYVKTAILTATNIKALNLSVGNEILMDPDAVVKWENVTGTTNIETISGAQAKIDSLEIGGVNLVLDSDTTRSSTNYLIHRYTLSEDWKVGQRYTVTIKGTINSGQKFGVWNDTGYDTLVYLTYNSDKGVWIGTGVVDYVRDNEERYASVYNVSSESAVTATIEWIKIEYGDKSTGWTPSPNDVRQLTNNAQTKADNAYTLADSKITDLQATQITQNTVTTSYVEGLNCNFKSGSVGNFSINNKILWSGAVSPVNTSGDVLRVSSENIGAGLAYNGSQILQGYSLTWHRASNAGHLVLGQMMEHASSIKVGYKGIQMMDYQSLEYFALGAKTDLSGSSSVYNRIAGCSFDHQSLWAGTGWKWNRDGSGYLGNGNVSWDTSGNVVLAPSVKMEWSQIKNANSQVTSITQNAINTGTINFNNAYGTNVNLSGHITATSGSFTGHVNATSGTFSGALSGATGNFSGVVTATSLYSGGFTASGSIFKSNNGNIQLHSNSSTIHLYRDGSSGQNPLIIGYNSGSQLVQTGGFKTENFAGSDYLLELYSNNILKLTAPKRIEILTDYIKVDGAIVNKEKWVYLGIYSEGSYISVEGINYLEILPDGSAHNEFRLDDGVKGQRVTVYNTGNIDIFIRLDQTGSGNIVAGRGCARTTTYKLYPYAAHDFIYTSQGWTWFGN